MLEMARWATATGESIFFGAARLWRPIMWLFFAIAIWSTSGQATWRSGPRRSRA